MAYVSAVLTGRFQFSLDTNFYFAAAGMHVGNLKYGFIPYYFFALLAVFTHIACFLYWYTSSMFSVVQAHRLGAAIIVIGALTSSIIVMMLAGAFYKVNIPGQYNAFYAGFG